MARKKEREETEITSEPSEDDEDKRSDDIYDEEKRQEMLEDDEITAAEEGFVRGWEGTVEGGKKNPKKEHKDTTSVALDESQYEED